MGDNIEKNENTDPLDIDFDLAIETFNDDPVKHEKNKFKKVFGTLSAVSIVLLSATVATVASAALVAGYIGYRVHKNVQIVRNL
jgi:hypothetical protein